MTEDDLFRPVRNFPEEEERVGTGPICFGDDWPGTFIRGDESHSFAKVLKEVISVLEERTDTWSKGSSFGYYVWYLRWAMELLLRSHSQDRLDRARLIAREMRNIGLPKEFKKLSEDLTYSVMDKGDITNSLEARILRLSVVRNPHENFQLERDDDLRLLQRIWGVEPREEEWYQISSG